MNARFAIFPIVAMSLAFGAGCGENKSAIRPSALPVVETTSSVSTSSASMPTSAQNGNVHVSDDIARACNMHFNDIASAPKFRFDESALLAEDRAVLAQVAQCVTTGPLAGRSIELVGRADPRGEAEYNMALGEHRAGSAWQYLTALGVAKDKVSETSRGKLDATGTDDASWQRDRRVDILLR